MVQVVGIVVEPLPVGHSVDDIEMQVLPEGQDKGQYHEPDRTVSKSHKGHPGVAVGPGNGVMVGVGTAVGAEATTPGVRDMVASGAGVAVGRTPYGFMSRVIAVSPVSLSDANVLLSVSVPPQTIW